MICCQQSSSEFCSSPDNVSLCQTHPLASNIRHLKCEINQRRPSYAQAATGVLSDEMSNTETKLNYMESDQTV